MTTSGLQRQPTQLDYASPTQFKFSILKLPKVEYFCTAVNIPGVSLSSETFATRFKPIPIPGAELTYEQLQMTFIVDENLENYQEIHGWLIGLGFPSDDSEYQNLLASGQDRFPTTGSNTTQDAGKAPKGPTQNLGPVYSDATLNVLSSKNNPILECRFQDVYPISLSGLNYNQQATDIDYLTASVTFNYLIYKFADPGGSSTKITAS
jgi:hypothetical protein